jgi:hypothetical protein
MNMEILGCWAVLELVTLGLWHLRRESRQEQSLGAEVWYRGLEFNRSLTWDRLMGQL